MPAWSNHLCGTSVVLQKPAQRLVTTHACSNSTPIWSARWELRKRKSRMLFSSKRGRRPGPNGPEIELISAVVAVKQRNPDWGCPRLAQQIGLAFGVEIDKNVVRHILSAHYRPRFDSGAPSWLTFLSHMKDSLWNCDLFRCESATFRTSTAASSMAWHGAGCSIKRFAGKVCPNTSARIMIRCIDSTKGKPIFEYSK